MAFTNHKGTTRFGSHNSTNKNQNDTNAYVKDCFKDDLRNNFNDNYNYEFRQNSNVSFDVIDLSVVAFDRKFARNRGTLSQIVKSLLDMYDRLSTPFNDYQKTLYPHIQQECQHSVDEYVRLINDIDPNDYFVFGNYLNGSFNNGRRKPTPTIHEQKSYGVSEFKETLKSINDRLRHIKNDCVRRNKTNIDGSDIYLLIDRVIIFCDEYHAVINSQLTNWHAFISHYRTTNNANVLNNTNNVIINNVTNNIIINKTKVDNTNNTKIYAKNKSKNKQNIRNEREMNSAKSQSIHHVRYSWTQDL